MLESYCHPENLFLTLTFDPEHLPEDGSVNPRDIQLFIKRLRQAVSPVKFRYFAVGEYGDKSFRPHYHLVLFGLGIRYKKQIDSCWRFGFTYYGTLTDQSAQYVAGYVVKKMTKKDDKRLNGRFPEFARMSLKPGLGYGALEKILDLMTHPSGQALLASGDVPTALRHGSKIFPLGRYLRTKLREMYGFSDGYMEILKQKTKEELPTLLNDFVVNTSNEEKKFYTMMGRILDMSAMEYSWRNPQMDLNLKARTGLRSRKL